MNTINGQIISKINLPVVCCLWLLAIFFGGGQTGLAQTKTQSPLPAPTGYVNDYAGVIDAATKQRLEAKLKRLKDSTDPSIEFAVAVVKTTNGADIFDYSLSVARGWGIGSKESDNPGLLLLVAIDDHKYFTQISRDLEGDLTDGESGQIQRNVLVPAFKQGNYGKGIEDTIDAYINNIAQSRGFDASAITGSTYNPPAPRSDVPRSPRMQSRSSLGTCCIALFVIIVILFMMSGRGGGRGGGGGLLSSLILGSLLSGAGRGGGWSSGGFGGSSGGSSGGWGDSGGGFGGFGGGGDFGGGGAGGSW